MIGFCEGIVLFPLLALFSVLAPVFGLIAVFPDLMGSAFLIVLKLFVGLGGFILGELTELGLIFVAVLVTVGLFFGSFLAGLGYSLNKLDCIID